MFSFKILFTHFSHGWSALVIYILSPNPTNFSFLFKKTSDIEPYSHLLSHLALWEKATMLPSVCFLRDGWCLQWKLFWISKGRAHSALELFPNKKKNTTSFLLPLSKLYPKDCLNLPDCLHCFKGACSLFSCAKMKIGTVESSGLYFMDFLSSFWFCIMLMALFTICFMYSGRKIFSDVVCHLCELQRGSHSLTLNIMQFLK